MRTNNYEKHELEKTPISRKCYSLIKETNLFRHCSRTIFSHEICDPPSCKSYASPISKWRNGDCPMADPFLKSTYIPPKEKKKVGHIKSYKKNRR